MMGHQPEEQSQIRQEERTPGPVEGIFSINSGVLPQTHMLFLRSPPESSSCQQMCTLLPVENLLLLYFRIFAS